MRFKREIRPRWMSSCWLLTRINIPLKKQINCSLFIKVKSFWNISNIVFSAIPNMVTMPNPSQQLCLRLCCFYVSNIFANRQNLFLPIYISNIAVTLMPSGKPAAACTADLQQLSFLVQYGFPRVVSLWLMEDSFRGHYPDGQPEPCDVSASDCRVMNCGDGEQAISMHRCFPPDRSIQGPPSLTQPGVPLCHSSSTPEERNECLSFKTSLKGVVLPF